MAAVTQRQMILTAVCVAILVIAGAAYFWLNGSSSGSVVPQSNERFGVQVTPYDRTQGSPNAPIVMLEYAAPTCPHCAHFNEEFFPTLKQQYIDTGKVYYIFRVYPLGAADVAAEAIARCLPANNYFSFIDLLFRNQMKWDPEYRVPDVRAALVDMAKIAGMGEAQVNSCISDQAAAQKITQVGQDASTKYGVSGTPTFIVNGQLHGPFSTIDEFKAFLDPMLHKK